MHKFIRMWALVAALSGTAMSVSAATPNEFYQGLLRRGTASYEAARYTDAAKQLRIAAFGLVEVVDQYQIAQVYLTLTYDKLTDPDRARDAARRVAAAERVERKFTGLPLPAAVRTAFESLAGKLLSPSDSATLLRGAEDVKTQTMKSAPAAATAQASSTPRRTTTPPQTKPQTTQAAEARNTTPAPKTVTAVPQRETPKTATVVKQPPATTASAPQTTKPTPPATTPTRPATSSAAKPAVNETSGRGGPIEPARPVAAAPAPRTLSASEVATKIAAAERGLNNGNLTDARRAFRDLLAAPGLEHETLVRVAEGLYRARDFSGALSAFNRLGTLRKGEEPYRYYIAVALYETGDFARAKKELAAALSFIEVTPDVARYRIKIEGAQ
jgi:hypothetical protein